MQIDQTFIYLLAILPIILIIYAIKKLFRASDFKRQGIITDAVIKKKEFTGTSASKTQNFYITYEYMDADEEKIRRNISVKNDLYHSLKEGEKIEIIYHSADTSRSTLSKKIDSEFNSSIIYIIISVIALGALFII